MRTLLSKMKRVLGGESPEEGTSVSSGRYVGDGMIVRGRNLSWLADPMFTKSYTRGVYSGHQWGKGTDSALRVEWRVHIALWAARHAMRLEGDFVECGVNTGILSLAVCDHLRFEGSGRMMYLFDTFAGTPESMMSDKEKEKRRMENQMYYPECYNLALENFAPYPNVKLVRGEVPASLAEVSIDKVAYLSIDMNVARAERAAIEHFWPKLSSGAIVVLDDYGWRGFEEQQQTMDEFARRQGVAIASLPTGQGLLVKP